MKRRNVLIGLGAIGLGGSAVLGTGAFSTVEANRTVTIESAGDAASFLALESAGEWADQFVDDDGDRIEIDITGAQVDDEDGFTGVNEDSNTSLPELIRVTNNGTVEIGLGAVIIGDNGEDELLSVEGIDSAPPLNPTESTTFGLEIELREEELDDDGDNIDAYDDGELTEDFDPRIDIIAVAQ